MNEIGCWQLVYFKNSFELTASLLLNRASDAHSDFDTNIEEADDAAAVKNVGMLVELASVVYCNTPALCNHCWLDWEEYCPKTDARNQNEQQHNVLIPIHSAVC
eukprot:13735192-Ditylum_brightwellii.AAC.1